MIQGLSFYLLLFLLFAAVGWFLYHALCNENGEFLGDYARWLVTRSEALFRAMTLREAKLRIGAWTLGPALLLGLVHPLLAIPGALFGWHVPRWLMRHQAQQRLKSFEAQLVDALVLLSNALRSGLSLLQGFRILVKEMPPPISQEFELVIREQQISAALDEALTNLGERVKSRDLDIVITAIQTLRETGGNLPETFDTVTYTIRERKKVEGKVDALTTMGVTQGVVACFMPWAFMAMMGAIQPQLVKPLLTTGIGWACLGLATVLDIVGYYFIRRMARIRV
jgi:tight adherence protein B